jgi:hypothetical protein
MVSKTTISNIKYVIAEVSILSFLVTFLLIFRFTMPMITTQPTVMVCAAFYALLRIYILPILTSDIQERSIANQSDISRTGIIQEMCIMPLNEKNDLLRQITYFKKFKQSYETTLRQLSDKDYKLRTAEQTISTQQRTIAKLQGAQQNSLQQSRLWQSEIEQLQEKKTELHAEIEQLQQCLTTEVDVKRILTNNNKQMSINNDRLQIKIVKLKRTLSDLPKRITLLREENARFLKEKAALLAKATDHNVIVAALEKKMVNLQVQIEREATKIQLLEQTVLNLHKQHDAHHDFLRQLVNTRILSQKQTSSLIPGYQWILTNAHCDIIESLIDEHTILVGSYVLYLLCQQYGMSTCGFENADIDLISRLTPAQWQEQYKDYDVQTLRLWNRDGMTVCQARFQQRNLDVVFVNIDPKLSWITWLHEDVYQRPDNSVSIFYGVKWSNKIIAYDPSGEGMLSLLTHSVRIFANDQKSIEAMLYSNPARILRLINVAAKFNLSIEPRTLIAVKKFLNDPTFVESMQCGWLRAKHEKYLQSSTREQYKKIFSKLDIKRLFFASEANNSTECQFNSDKSTDGNFVTAPGILKNQCENCRSFAW